MNNPAQFDLAVLSTIRPGVNTGMAELKAQLAKFWHQPDVAALGVAQNEAQRVSGVFRMVGAEGLAVYCSEIATVLSELAAHPASATTLHRDALDDGLQALTQYLDEMAQGMDNATLRLFPSYQQLQQLRGLEMSFELDLFYPNLNIALPTSVTELPQAGNPQAQIKVARGKYQLALVHYLRQLDINASLQQMQQAMLMAMQTFPVERRAYWWIAAGFFDCLSIQRPSDDMMNVPKLLGRIDQQLRLSADGQGIEDQPELHQMLYLIASQPAQFDGVGSDVGTAYALQRYVAVNAISPSLLNKRLEVIGQHLKRAEESWASCVSGGKAEFSNFLSQVGLVEQYCEKLDPDTLQVLARAIAQYAQYAGDAEQAKALGLDMAMALLLMQRGLSSYHHLDGDFQRQALVLSERMHQAVTDPSGEERPIAELISLYCGQESALVKTILSKEMFGNLQRVENALGAFLEGRGKPEDMPALSREMRQIRGGLSMVGLHDAAAISESFLRVIERFAKDRKMAERGDARALANALSALENYLVHLPHLGQSHTETLLTAGKDLVELEHGKPFAPGSTMIMQPVTISPTATSSEDFELIEIFLDEADEVLQIMRDNLHSCHLHELCVEPLTTIRRGFHTLKGSGRMVGLNTLGEVAWSLERAMNVWLQDAKPVAPALLKMVELAIPVFAAWMDKLRHNQPVDYAASELLELAAKIESRSEDSYEFATAVDAPTISAPVQHENNLMLTDAHAASVVGAPTHMEIPVLVGEPVIAEMFEPVAAETANEVLVGEPLLTTDESVKVEKEVHLPSAQVIEFPLAPATPEEAEDTKPVQIGAVNLSAALFKIGSEESAEHVATLQTQLDRLRSHRDMPHIEYDFMRAAHTLAGVNRVMGFTTIVDLSAALEVWLNTRMEHPFRLEEGQLELLQNTISTLDRMVQDLCARQYPRASSDMVYLLNMDKDKLHVVVEPPVGIEVLPGEIEHGEVALTHLLVGNEGLHGNISPAVIAQDVPEFFDDALSSEEIPASDVAKSEAPRELLVRDEVDEQLVPIFLEEADDLIPKIGEQIRVWREQPADTQAVQLLNRLLHTLKGSARMAGAMRIGQLAHELESAVLTSGRHQHTASYWDGLEQEFDHIQNLLQELRTGEVAPAAENEPHRRTSDRIAADVDKRMLEIGAERALQSNMLRVRADVVDRLVNEASEISVARARVEAELRAFKDGLLELTESVSRLRKQVREVEIQAESQMQARVSLVHDHEQQFDPLEFDRFTRLQELTRFMNESVHDVQTVQQALLKNLDETTVAITAQARLNRELQQGLMNVRMVPFNSMTDRLYRIVRQTGKELNKRANLELSGTSLELDRSVLEKMAAPFEHLLRNAMAHGLESEAERVKLGKQPIGDIRLGLRQENNEVVFELSDDGAGLNFAALRAKAIANGLLQESEHASDEQLSQLIFASGVSTATEVTEVAGRGIGMDVVRSEITALGGRIDVTSQAGKGTKFIIHLPLTLAVTQVLMVRCRDTVYAIPAAMVEQVRQLKSADMEEIYVQRQITWQEKHYALHYLPQLLRVTATQGETQAWNSILLLRSGDARMALHIDEMIGNQEAVVKNIGPQLARLPGIAGATVRGDGRVVLILNPLQIPQNLSAVSETVVVEPEAPRKAPLIMVVDDSLTVRKITTRVLTRLGYDVVTAKDGVDALEQLSDIMPAVMLLDVEMPRMDGFELTKRLRQDSRTRYLPIIMITSRTADKHREHALQLGVNAYLGKPYQEDDLLARIAEYAKVGG